MKQIIFTETGRGDRTNIMSSFQLWSKETFLENVKDKKQWRKSYRYGYVDSGWVKLTKDMPLNEFETVFTSAEIQIFSPEQITAFFRKEISEKYGEHKLKTEIKTLGRKDLVRGTIYEDVNNSKYLFLGKVRLKIEKNPGYGKNEIESEKEGLGFDWFSGSEFKDSDITGVDVLKGIKKLVKAVGSVELRRNYSYVMPKGAYRYDNRIYNLDLI